MRRPSGTSTQTTANTRQRMAPARRPIRQATHAREPSRGHGVVATTVRVHRAQHRHHGAQQRRARLDALAAAAGPPQAADLRLLLQDTAQIARETSELLLAAQQGLLARATAAGSGQARQGFSDHPAPLPAPYGAVGSPRTPGRGSSYAARQATTIGVERPSRWRRSASARRRRRRR